MLYFLSGLTCTEETFCIKSHAQKYASELGLMLISPDTSPREPRIPGDADHWDFGLSAGFYLDATQAPWSQNYRMYSYVVRELPEIVAAHLPAALERDGYFRPLHGRPWRLDPGVAQSGAVQVGIGIFSDRRADAIALGEEGLYQLPGAGHRNLARA